MCAVGATVDGGNLTPTRAPTIVCFLDMITQDGAKDPPSTVGFETAFKLAIISKPAVHRGTISNVSNANPHMRGMLGSGRRNWPA